MATKTDQLIANGDLYLFGISPTFTVKLVRGGGNWLVFDTFLRKLGQELSFCAILLLYSVMELLLVVSPIFSLTLGRDKSLPSYQWFLHVNWWVDFVYITNLPFSSLYLCIITLSNVRFMFRIIIDQVPVLYLFWSLVHPLSWVGTTYYSYWHQLYYQTQSEAFFTFDR